MKKRTVILSVLFLLLLDQISKYIVVNNIALSQKIVLIPGFFNLTYVRNFGAGFSILQNQTFFLLAMSFLVSAYLLYQLFKDKTIDKMTSVSYILIVSGALGNMIDRLRLTYVIDFLDFIIFGYDYPVFNIADSFITIGCILLIFIVLRENRNA